jgi:hypothetical protein
MVQASIILEGQEQGDNQHDLMGVYELAEGKEVNGRGMWQIAGGRECFMYYGSNKMWYVGNRARMEAGESGGWMKVTSTALTPDQITEAWEVGKDGGGEWLDAPQVKTQARGRQRQPK